MHFIKKHEIWNVMNMNIVVFTVAKCQPFKLQGSFRTHQLLHSTDLHKMASGFCLFIIQQQKLLCVKNTFWCFDGSACGWLLILVTLFITFQLKCRCRLPLASYLLERLHIVLIHATFLVATRQMQVLLLGS